MQTKDINRSPMRTPQTPFPASEQIQAPPSTGAVLVVGSEKDFDGTAVPLYDPNQTTSVGFEDVTNTLLDDAQPRTIFSRLMGDGFDCLDLAKRLEELGFPGAYRVIAFDVPHPSMIRREIAQACPSLDFDLICKT